MSILYLDCSMGAAGDMLSAALLELLPDPEGFVNEVNALGLPGVQVEREAAVKCGVTGTHMKVTVYGEEEESHDHGHGHKHEYLHDHHHDHEHEHGHHHHSSLHDIEHIVRDHLPLSGKVKDDIMAVYGLIAQAESHAHGMPVEQIHFHEVGTLDAVADITMVCMLMERLSPSEVVASPVRVGSGQVRCAHGILPVPAPATAHILQGVPIYAGGIQGELCTPTGAALLKHFSTRFGDMPVMTTQAVGYGMGKKDFEAANYIRAFLGEGQAQDGTVLELSCNVDDMTAEEIGFAMERLFDAGALDVYTIPIGMKKSRPGTLIRVLCRPEDREAMTGLLFRHTTTLGVREATLRRHTLERKAETVDGPCGPVRRKVSAGYGVTRSKYEFEDLAAIARAKGLSLREAMELLEQ